MNQLNPTKIDALDAVVVVSPTCMGQEQKDQDRARWFKQLQVARDKMVDSFQTTLIAAHLTLVDDLVQVRILGCGDSAFFAFTADGDLLLSSLSDIGNLRNNNPRSITNTPSSPVKKINFGPGDHLLVKVHDDPKHQKYIQQCGIDPKFAKNWLVCSALDLCQPQDDDSYKGKTNDSSLTLKIGDFLLVPMHLSKMSPDYNYQAYRQCLFSHSIKLLTPEVQSQHHVSFDQRGAATAVLPDSVSVKAWRVIEDRFAQDSQYLLCSDGFYSCFTGPDELWHWLNTNKKLLQNPKQQQNIIKILHRELHRKCGDDDISFVWVYPKHLIEKQSVDSLIATEKQGTLCPSM